MKEGTSFFTVSAMVPVVESFGFAEGELRAHAAYFLILGQCDFGAWVLRHNNAMLCWLSSTSTCHTHMHTPHTYDVWCAVWCGVVWFPWFLSSIISGTYIRTTADWRD
jgi:hypothetical protein